MAVRERARLGAVALGAGAAVLALIQILERSVSAFSPRPIVSALITVVFAGVGATRARARSVAQRRQFLSNVLRRSPLPAAAEADPFMLGESKEGLCLCLGGRRHSYRESPYRDCSCVKETCSLECRLPVREATSRGVRTHEGITGRLRGMAVAEFDAYNAQGVNVSIGCQAGDLHVGESSRSLGCQNRRCRNPLQRRGQIRSLSEHHLYIGQLLSSDLASRRTADGRLGQRSGMSPERLVLLGASGEL